jgi:tetratricopeptide (TPR) repeat protein
LRDQDKKQAALQKLAQEHPNSWEIAEIQGYAAWRANNQDEARRRFSDAARLGSTNARMYYDYSGLLRQASRRGGEEDAAIIALLEKAVGLQPEFPQARYNLGIHYYNARDYEKAAEHLGKAGTVDSREALQYFRLLADSFHRIGQSGEAVKAAERARQYARSPEEAEEIDELIAYVSGNPPPRRAEIRREASGELSEADSAEEEYAESGSEAEAAERQPGLTPETNRPRLTRRISDTPMENEGYSESREPAREQINGTLLVLDCLGEPGAKLTIMSGRQQIPLLIADPTAIAITGVPGGQFDFVCGPQKPVSVAVEYEATENEELGTLGIVRAIEFR